MSIWHQPITPEALNERGSNTLSDLLGIRFVEVTEESLTATMPITAQVKQPMGVLHGGANVVLAETIASTAANAVVDLKHYYCVGLEINANHLRPVHEGHITAITRPIHLGKTTQIWLVDIFNAAGKQTCVSRMTAAVIKR